MNKLKYFLLACLAAGLLNFSETIAASSSNTLVRFQLRNGVKLFGNIDVELFDNDKPVTVSNFLHYVRSGAFNHTFLDVVSPGYFLGGGTYTIANPYSEELFEELSTIPENPAITNEFNTTRIIPNLAGTLAMSLSYTNIGTNDATTVRDSATTGWFFNLWDNSTDLDVDFDGQGFVVFGRIIKGMNVLNFFNTISTNSYVLDMDADSFFYGCNDPREGTNTFRFGGLPIGFDLKSDDDFRCIQYNDLFNVSISVIRSTNVTDYSPPKFKLAYPASTTVITNNFLTVTGLVSDVGSGVQSITIQVAGRSPLPATLTSNNTFYANLTAIPAGSNYLLLEVADNRGNRQLIESHFFYQTIVPFKFSIAGTGTGSVSGLNFQQPLGDGSTYGIIYDQVYTFRATPSPTNLFSGWLIDNQFYGNQNPLSILIRTNDSFTVSNLGITAVFDTNYFPFLKGAYSGLFLSPSPVNPSHSGFFTLNLTDSGSYSAKISMNGYVIPFSGRFRSGNSITNQYLFLTPAEIRGGLPFASVWRMGFDILQPTKDQLVGNLMGLPDYTNILATILADRAPVYVGTNRSPYEGKYTLSIQSDGSLGGPVGDGYGIVTVNPKGAVASAGALADGTKFAQKTPTSKDGYWPLYVAPLKTNAALISWVNFTNEPASDFSGLFNWFKFRNTTKYYTNGFTNEAMIVGSRFLGPNATNQTLFLTNATIGFTNGNLVADFANSVSIAPNGKVTNLGSNKLSLSISSGNGLMTGSVTPPSGGKAVSFKGVVIQKQTNAAGYFLGTNQSGSVHLSR